MRVLLLHNRYRELGGEDRVALLEARTLRAHGVEVVEVKFDNETPAGMSLGSKVRLGWSAAWSDASYKRVRSLCEQERPDVAHVHNFWMKLSPSAHAACHAAGVPTVQTLHNFRLLCPMARFLRNDQPCEDCLGKVPWRGVVHRCYRQSFLASGAVARMIVFNRERGTWETDVDAFISLSDHARSKFIAGGLPASRIFVKRNFVEDPGPPRCAPSSSDLIVYAGRLSSEKGLNSLLSTWSMAGLSRLGRLLIVGDGPEKYALQKQAMDLGLSPERVKFTGMQSRCEVDRLLATARAAVLPSLWTENCPMSVLEAYSHGRAIIASEASSVVEIVHHDHTGFIYPIGSQSASSEALRTILTDPCVADRLGSHARKEYLAHYTPERNYEELMNIYRFALDRRAAPLPDHLRLFDPREPTTDAAVQTPT